MIKSIQLSMQHIANWLPIFLWVIMSGFNFVGVNTYEARHIETHHKNELSDYFDAVHANRKFRYDVSEINSSQRVILII